MKEIMRFESNYYGFMLKLEADEKGAARLIMLGGNGLAEDFFDKFEDARREFMDRVTQHSQPGYLRATA